MGDFGDNSFYFADFPDLGLEDHMFDSFGMSGVDEGESRPMDVEYDERGKKEEVVEDEFLDESDEMFPNKPGNFRLMELTGRMEEYSHRMDKLMGKAVSRNGYDDVAELKKRILEDSKETKGLLLDVVLAVEDVYCCWWLLQKFRVLLAQCQVYLNSKDASASPSSLVKLVWVDQPLPKSFKNKNRARASNKNKMAHVTMVAQVVSAPGFKFAPSGDARAVLYAGARATQIPLENNVSKVSKSGSVVLHLRFCAGTRSHPHQARLQVEGTVTDPQGRRAPLHLLGEPSSSLVVITNEGQYGKSEHLLMERELFGEEREGASWAQFLNALQVRWMRVTRQEEESGINTATERRIRRDDVVYLRDRFFPDAPVSVTREQVKAFYGFFGKVAHVYRHNAGVRKLWLRGAVWGNISKNNAQALLRAEQPGTFLIRHSESEPGVFVLSWLDRAGSVMHSKINSKLLINMKKCADVLRGKAQLQNVLQPFSVVRKKMSSRQTVVPKDKVFKDFYSPGTRKKESPGEGYVDLLDI